jgi:subtilisin family serine protease
VLVAAGNDGSNSFSKTVGSPATCKNCLSVGATQLSDALFRGMKPMIDQGWHCKHSTFGCCTGNSGRDCVQTSETESPCCSFTSIAKMSLACCPTAFSSNVRHPYNVAAFSSRGTTFGDGRIKPDLAVPGEDILSAAAPGVDSSGNMILTTPNYCTVPSSTSSRTATDAENAATRTRSGTSMATPLAAGAVEKIRQYFRQGYYPSGIKGSATAINPDESLLRAVILASARPLVDGGVWSGLPFSTWIFSILAHLFLKYSRHFWWVWHAHTGQCRHYAPRNPQNVLHV